MRTLALLALLLAACGGVAVEAESPADSVTSELRARAGETSVWVRPLLVRRLEDDGATRLLISGRASRNLEGGFGFVFDDPYGDFRVLSARRFELAFGTSELINLIVGVPELVQLSFPPSATGPQNLTARVLPEVRALAAPGSGLYLDGQPRAVSVGSRPVVRILGHADRRLVGLQATAGGVQLDVQRLDDRHFAIDLLVDHVAAIAGVPGGLQLTGQGARSSVRRQATLDLAIGTLELTTEDAYDTWPNPGCQDAVRACLEAAPAGTVDLSGCGSYREVRACPQGAQVTDVALQAAFQRLAARLDAPAFQDDARALVGAQRQVEFLEAARLTGEGQLEPYYGRRYPSVAAREAALDAVIEESIDNFYARPLDLVEAYGPRPNDALLARQVAADALLLHLASLDLTQSEWGRPLSTLTRQFRARHVDSLRELREEGPIGGESPTSITFMVDWLDALVEVTVDRASGEVTRLLFEVD